MRRTRPAARDFVECSAKHARDIRGAIEHCIPFRRGTHQRALVDLGQRVPAARRHRDVAGDAKEWHRGLVRLDDARQDVGRAAAAWPFADADLARNARIAVGHVRRVALIAREHVADPVRQARQCIVEGEAGIAAEAEDDLDLVRPQHFDYRFGARQCCGTGLDRLVHARATPRRRQ
jgi:hypothetical protein